MFSRNRQLFIIPAIVAAAVLLLVSLLPSAIRIGATLWLESHGARQVEIANVDLNLFKGTFVMEGFSADAGLKVGRLALDIDWWPMLSRQLFVRSLALKDVEAEAHQREDGTWQLAGIVPDQAAEPEKTARPGEPWQVVLNDIDFSDVQLKANGKIDNEPFDLSLPLRSLKLSLLGSEESGAQRLKNSIRLGKVTFNGAGYSVESAALQLNNTILLPPAGTDIIAGLKLDDLKLNLDGFQLLGSGVRLAAVDAVELDHLSIAGNSRAAFDLLSLKGVVLQSSDNNSSGRIEILSLHGADLEFPASEQSEKIAVDNIKASLKKLKMSGFTLHDDRQNIALTAVDTIELDQLSVTGRSRAAFDLLSLQGIALPASGDDSLGRIEKVILYDGNLDLSGAYRVKKIAVHDLHASLKKQKNGRISVLDRLQGSSKTGAAPAAEAGKAGMVVSSDGQVTPEPDISAAAGKQPVIYIEELLLSKGSTVAFRDESVVPVFDIGLQVEKFSFIGIDSSGQESGKLNALLTVGKNGSLTIQGEIAPNVSVFRSDLKITLKNFDMTGLSGHIEPDFGHSIQTGQLDLQSGVRIADSRVEATNSLMIRKLALKKSPKPGKAVQSLGMPVDTAIDLLRDSRGDISIDVPITGRLDSPDINFNDLVRKAVTSAMSMGAISYAKHLLQPYGSIITAVQLVSGMVQEAARPRLTPVQFSERSSTLGSDMSEYAEKIAALMKSRNFRLQICGVATRIEGGGATPERPRIMNDEQLLGLAIARSDAVLKAIQDHGITAKRLFNCSPAIDEKSAKVLPRVELILD